MTATSEWEEEKVTLEHNIWQLQEENRKLKRELEKFKTDSCVKETTTTTAGAADNDESSNVVMSEEGHTFLHPNVSYKGDVSPDQIERYSRQLLLRGGFGVAGQQKLLRSKVLVVGAGGIGSTVLLYLAACGIGHLSVVDFDVVEVSNLHRQIIHQQEHVSMNKAESARRAIHHLNPSIDCRVIAEPLTGDNALTLIAPNDCVVDASDNPQTRYLINDACVLSQVPLVSGSAMGLEGQITVYNYKQGPCYRCLYPKPSIKEGLKSCSDNGVLGPVPGLIGVLQAIETIKVLTGIGMVMSDRLLMYDALQCSFLRIKKPPKQRNCPACGSKPIIQTMKDSLRASQSARGPSCAVRLNTIDVAGVHQISCQEYRRIQTQTPQNHPHILLDVRAKEQYELCSLPGAISIPLESLPQRLKEVAELSAGQKRIYCLCRRGFASAVATNMILEATEEYPSIASVNNIVGGLDAWRAQVDETFPTY